MDTETGSRVREIAELLGDIAMSDDLATQGPAINALSNQLKAHTCNHVAATELHRLAGNGWARPADLIARADELDGKRAAPIDDIDDSTYDGGTFAGDPDRIERAAEESDDEWANDPDNPRGTYYRDAQ